MADFPFSIMTEMKAEAGTYNVIVAPAVKQYDSFILYIFPSYIVPPKATSSYQ